MYIHVLYVRTFMGTCTYMYVRVVHAHACTYIRTYEHTCWCGVWAEGDLGFGIDVLAMYVECGVRVWVLCVLVVLVFYFLCLHRVPLSPVLLQIVMYSKPFFKTPACQGLTIVLKIFKIPTFIVARGLCLFVTCPLSSVPFFR